MATLIRLGALATAAALVGCGTLLNVAGYQNTLRALNGPDKGLVVSVPQAAVFGGCRLDMVMAYASGVSRQIDGGWLLGKYTQQDMFTFGEPTYCLVGWWPTPCPCLWLCDLPLSFAADLLLLPVTLFSDPGRRKPSIRPADRE